MKPSEFYEKYIMLQDHQGNWHKPRPINEMDRAIMDNDGSKTIIFRKGLRGPRLIFLGNNPTNEPNKA